MAARYQYYGVFRQGDAPAKPSSLFRTWTGPDGREREEVFTADLVWKPSFWTSSMSRPGFYDDDYVPVDEAVAMRFIKRVRGLRGSWRPLKALLEARPVIPVRNRTLSRAEALTLIRDARRPADAGFRDYRYDRTDDLYAAHATADDDGRRQLRDVAEQLLLDRGDDCPIGAVDVLSRWSAWGAAEPARLDRFVRHYLERGPLQQLGRVLWAQSSWITPVQVTSLETAVTGDPMRHLPVCMVVLKHSYFATGTMWEALATILRSSTEPETLARIHDAMAASTGGADFNEIVRSRNLPRPLLDAIGERTTAGVDSFLAGIV
jgi:hypothetical protein